MPPPVTSPVPALGLPDNAQPVPVVTPPPATGTGALASLATANADQFQTQLDQKATDAKQNYQTPLTQYLQALSTSPTQAGITSQAYNDNGVNTGQQALTDINNRILAEKNATQQGIANLKNSNPQGFFGTGLDQAVQKMQDQSDQRLANMAVEQAAASGNYANARAIADRAVAAQYEHQQNYLGALKTMADYARQDWTTAETRAFDSALAVRTNQLELQKQESLAKFQQQIQQADPYYQAKTANEQAQASLNQANASLFQQMAGTGPGSGSTDLSTNPGAIKLGAATQHWVDQGLATVSPNTAADGGHFLIFKDLASGIQAQKELLFGPTYSNLSVSQALSKWSNGGYSGTIAPDIANKKMSDLTPAEQNYLMATQMHREGTSSPAAYSAALAGDHGFPGDPKTASAAALLNYAALQGHVDPNAIKITRGNPASVMSYVNILRANPDFNFNAASANAAAVRTAATTQARTSANLQQSAGTVIAHLPEVADALKTLNRGSGVLSPLVNSWKNTVGAKTDPNVQNYLSKLNVLRGEVTNVLAGQGVPTDKARSEAEGILPSNMGYDAFMNLIGNVKDGTGLLNLMNEKIKQYGQPTLVPQQKVNTDSFKPL